MRGVKGCRAQIANLAPILAEVSDASQRCEKGLMKKPPDKTRTVVVIERHEQTIIRRSRRTTSAQVVALPPERAVPERRGSPGWWLKTIALKSATVLAPWSRRLKARAAEHKNRVS
jgi:hypothetical protein